MPVPLVVRRIRHDWCAVRCPAALLAQLHDIFLRVGYVGDIAEAYIDGQLVADNFYNGLTREIGLKRFVDRLAEHELVLMRQLNWLHREQGDRTPQLLGAGRPLSCAFRPVSGLPGPTQLGGDGTMQYV